VLLAGLGNTAHVFDHFAHQFTYGFRVIGLTRRGFGASTHPETGYDIGTRAHDVLAVADALHLDRLVLIGHSIAGDEATRFAASYPGRTRAVIYLDAAYNRTKVPQLPQPEPEPTTEHDLASVENWAAAFARETNSRLPTVEVCNTRDVWPDGRVGDRKTANAIPGQIAKLLEPPEYDRIRVPVLAFYARPEARHTFPRYSSYSADSRARADKLIEVTRLYQQDSIRGLKRAIPDVRVEFLDGGHYLFVTNESDVVRISRQFLDRLGKKSSASKG
jgi:pimeloyl-ACP methyl ester carboxylesterase